MSGEQLTAKELNKFMMITNFLMEELEPIRQEFKLILESCDSFE